MFGNTDLSPQIGYVLATFADNGAGDLEKTKHSHEKMHYPVTVRVAKAEQDMQWFITVG